jgi:hypothetical protein
VFRAVAEASKLLASRPLLLVGGVAQYFAITIVGTFLLYLFWRDPERELYAVFVIQVVSAPVVAIPYLRFCLGAIRRQRTTWSQAVRPVRGILRAVPLCGILVFILVFASPSIWLDVPVLFFVCALPVILADFDGPIDECLARNWDALRRIGSGNFLIAGFFRALIEGCTADSNLYYCRPVVVAVWLATLAHIYVSVSADPASRAPASL